MIWSWALEARRKSTRILTESRLLETISGSYFLIEVSVGKGPWSDPVWVISFIDLLIDVDMQSILLCPAENTFSDIEVFLSCQRPASNGNRIRFELIIILWSRPFCLLSRKLRIGDLIIFFRHRAVAFLEGCASFLYVLAYGGMLRFNWEELTTHTRSERLLALILKNLWHARLEQVNLFLSWFKVNDKVDEAMACDLTLLQIWSFI